MRRNDPKPVGDILAELVKTTDLGKKLQQARIWDQWERIAGKNLAKHGRPHAIRDATLIVEVDSTVWMNRYAYQKWSILRRANRMAKRELVSDIFITLTPDSERGSE